ncbi:MAG: hypothetical protein JSV62_12825 [Promethearchaeota archaeon]|nr:MAG: hypothetical protein JSV62_12825 [Candidatus Lokiarchaeota archaeon]
MRYECKDCKSNEDVKEISLNYCPQCGSSNIKIYEFEEDDTIGYLRGVEDMKSKISKEEGISVGSRILIVLIGVILVLVGGWLSLSGIFYQMGSTNGMASGLPLGITLAIIGFIIVAFGSKGECCDC